MNGLESTEPAQQADDSEDLGTDLGLARELSELARKMQAEPDVGSLLQQIVHASVAEIPGAEHAGITVVKHGRFATAACTSELVDQIDAIQYEIGQGPCVQTSETHQAVIANDLEHEHRWGQFGKRAAKLGVKSMLSVQLFAGQEDYGTLNLYSADIDAFDHEAEGIAQLLASHAAIAMSASQTESGLRAALNSRDLIGQAKGILMERYKLTSPQAFAMLASASQNSNRKLRDVAEEVVTTGEFS
jgi:GAF domain-containing protein